MTTLEKSEQMEPSSHPLYRIGSQVTDHEARIRMLERDYQEIKALRIDMQAVQIELSAVKASLLSLPERIKEMMHGEILSHEKVEGRAQNAMVWKVLFLTFSFIGAGGYLIAQWLLARFGG